jgi:hypothetical protein
MAHDGTVGQSDPGRESGARSQESVEVVRQNDRVAVSAMSEACELGASQ